MRRLSARALLICAVGAVLIVAGFAAGKDTFGLVLSIAGCGLGVAGLWLQWTQLGPADRTGHLDKATEQLAATVDGLWRARCGRSASSSGA